MVECNGCAHGIDVLGCPYAPEDTKGIIANLLSFDHMLKPTKPSMHDLSIIFIFDWYSQK